MGKYDPFRCEFIFETGIDGLFRQIANGDTGITLLRPVEMEDLNALDGVVGAG